MIYHKKRKKVCIKTRSALPRSQVRYSGFESDWDSGSAQGIMGKVKRQNAPSRLRFQNGGK